MDKKTLEIVLKARDQVSAVMKKVGTSSKAAGRAMKRGFEIAKKAARAAASAVKLVGRAIKTVLGPIGLLVSALGLLSGAALFAGIKSAADFGDEIEKMSQRLGLSTELLSELRYQAELSGTDFKAAASGYKILARNIFDANTGVGEAVKAFDQLNIGVTDATGDLRPMEEVIGDIADKFSVMEDGTEKTALSMKLFSRQGADLIPLLNAGREGLAGMAEEAKKLGIVLSIEDAQAAAKFNDQLSRLFAALRGLKFQVALVFFDDLSALLTKLGDWIADNRDQVVKFFEEVNEVAKGMAEAISDAIEGDTAKLEQMLAILGKFFDSSFDGIGRASGKAFARGMRDSLNSVLPNVLIGAFKVMDIAASRGGGAGEVITRSFRQMIRDLKALKEEELPEPVIGVADVINLGGTGEEGDAGRDPTFFEKFLEGMRNTTEEIKKEFEDWTKLGENFAKDMNRAISDNMLGLLTQEFETFADFLDSLFRDIVRSILQKLTDLFASNVVSLFETFFTTLIKSFATNVVVGGGSAAVGAGGGAGSSLNSNALPSVVGAPLIGLTGPTAVPTPSGGGNTFIIHAVDPRSFQQMISAQPGAVASAVIRAVGQSQSTRTGLAGALGR